MAKKKCNSEIPKKDFIAIKNCARCGKNHRPLKFVQFKQSSIEIDDYSYTHWAICPTTKEPLLLTFIPDTDS